MGAGRQKSNGGKDFGIDVPMVNSLVRLMQNNTHEMS